MRELGDGALDGSVHGAVPRAQLPRKSRGGAHEHGEEEGGLRERAHHLCWVGFRRMMGFVVSSFGCFGAVVVGRRPDLAVGDGVEGLVPELRLVLGQRNEALLAREALLWGVHVFVC